MALILSNSLEWMPVLRINLGVDAIDLPDDVLDNELMISLAEERVVELLPDWASLFTAKATQIKMAAICFLAAQFCQWCKVNILTSESEGNYKGQRQAIDWDRKEVELNNSAMSFIAKADPTTVSTLQYIAIISPATPLYEPV
jgi:hypothetical protein